MKLFGCRVCQQTLFFESVQCTRCGNPLAFLPDRSLVCAMEPAPASGTAPSASGPALSRGSAQTPPPAQAQARDTDATWRAIGDDSGRRYRHCKNQIDHEVCNWAVAANDDSAYCLACRLNHMIPSLATPAMKERWHALEIAKRRVLYSLFELGLPVEGKDVRPDGLQFDFLQDGATPDQRVMTGHNDGVITINVAEAEDPFREKTRVELGESYRTVLGHFRHEIGHYYWDRLVKDQPCLGGFRELFGDERPDYGEAQHRHYSQGAPADWMMRFVSAYASMHPWEDWAETWAHYLHITDALETARAHGLSLRPTKESVKEVARVPELGLASRNINLHSFADLIEGWIPLTLALNNLNRSMGMKDAYPFILSEVAVRKLRFVYEVVESARGTGAPLR